MRRSKLQFSTRRATIRDLNILIHERRAMWEDMGVKVKSALNKTDVAYRAWARKHLRDGSLVGWIVEDWNGAVAGGGCVWLRPAQPRPGYDRGLQPYLLSMYTEPGFRRMGVASIIVNEAVAWSKKNGYPSIRLHASEVGRKLYHRLGFKRAWEMKLELKKSLA